MNEDTQWLTVEALAKILSQAASGFDCERELLDPHGDLVRGCEVNIRYGADGKPERVTVLLT